MTPIRISVKEILPRIYHLKFNSQRAMGYCFLRFQEFYESPNPRFRARVFTVDEYKKWYIKQKGAFSYYIDWGGYNLPDHIFKPFKEGRFNPLHPGERALLNVVSKIKCSPPFYIIATTGNTEAIAHEVSHGLWYLSKSYREEMKRLLRKLPTDFKGRFRKALSKGGYCRAVMQDELAAYLLTDHDWFKSKRIGLKKHWKIINGIRDLFQEHTSN